MCDEPVERARVSETSDEDPRGDNANPDKPDDGSNFVYDEPCNWFVDGERCEHIPTDHVGGGWYACDRHYESLNSLLVDNDNPSVSSLGSLTASVEIKQEKLDEIRGAALVSRGDLEFIDTGGTMDGGNTVTCGDGVEPCFSLLDTQEVALFDAGVGILVVPRESVTLDPEVSEEVNGL